MIISFPIFSESKRNAVDEITELGDKLSVDVSKYRKKRSLDANAYCWVLIGKLAAKLNKPSTEIYREAIKEVGDNHEVVCVIDKAVEKLRRSWQHNGLGWITDTMPSKIEGCTNVILYYGSSTYDTEQMNRLIQNICEECEEHGIDTRTPNEIAELISLWEQANEKHNSE
jgi:hypothetical protein